MCLRVIVHGVPVTDIFITVLKFFYRHELVKPLQYYWRVEYVLNRARAYFSARDIFIHLNRPDVKFFCDLDYDPFLLMEEQNKMYGTLYLLQLSFESQTND